MKHTIAGPEGPLQLSPIAYHAKVQYGALEVQTAQGHRMLCDRIVTLGRGTFKLHSLKHDCQTLLQWHEVGLIHKPTVQG